MNLKEFDLQKALNGEPICYRNGEVPMEWHYFEGRYGEFKIVSIGKGGDLNINRKDGCYLFNGLNHPYDLFMLSKKKTLWYCVWRNENGAMGATTPGAWKSAEEYLREYPTENILAEHTIEVDDN